MIVAAVPVKDLINAKQRLVPALGAAERAALAAAMLQDVLAALAAARLDRVWVVTRGPEPRVLVRPGLGLDVDAPDDLAALLAAPGATVSARLVASWRAGGRLRVAGVPRAS